MPDNLNPFGYNFLTVTLIPIMEYKLNNFCCDKALCLWRVVNSFRTLFPYFD